MNSNKIICALCKLGYPILNDNQLLICSNCKTFMCEYCGDSTKDDDEFLTCECKDKRQKLFTARNEAYAIYNKYEKLIKEMWDNSIKIQLMKEKEIE